MTVHYDREGSPISMQRWGSLFADYEYRVVDSTRIDIYHVSTVWLGLDHQYGDGPPLIFETMVFSEDQWNDNENMGLTDIDCERYSTLDEAVEGHRRMCELIRATVITEHEVLSETKENR